jgi:hypothetical protein
LFLLVLPSLRLLLGNQLINRNELVTLNYSMSYTLTCVAQNSRPNVNVNIIDGINNISLENYPSVSGVYRSSLCDSSSFCTSLMYLTISLNDTMYLSLKSLICQAENTTEPYALFTTFKINISVIDINGSPSKFHICSFANNHFMLPLLRNRFLKLNNDIRIFWFITFIRM